MTWKLPPLSFATRWLEERQTSILSAATIIGLANIGSLLAGLVRERLLIGLYFETEASQAAYEAFKVAFQVPNLIYQIVIVGALSATLIPIFTKYHQQNEAEAHRLASSIFNLVIFLFILVSMVIAVLAEPLTRWRTGADFSPEQIAIVTNLTRIMLLAQLSFAASNFLTGLLQAYHRFVLPAVAPVFYNIGIIVGAMLLYETLGIYAAGWGVVLGAALHLLIQVPLLFRVGFRYQFSLNISLPGIKDFFTLAPPRTMSLIVSELRMLSLGFFATSIATDLSFLTITYGLMLMAMPIRFVGIPIGQAALPFLSSEADQKSRQRFTKLLMQSINLITFLSFPAAAVILILRIPIVRLVYGTSNFPWQMTVDTSQVLAVLALSIAAQAVGQLLIRGFYALNDTKTPLLITSVDFVLYLVLCWVAVFVLDWGVLGIAAVTTFTAILEFALLGFFMHRRVPKLFANGWVLNQLKIITASFLMAVFLYLPYKILDGVVFDTSRTIELLALTVSTGTIGFLVYVYFALLFGIPELRYVAEIFNKLTPTKHAVFKVEEVVVDNRTDQTDTM